MRPFQLTRLNLPLTFLHHLACLPTQMSQYITRRSALPKGRFPPITSTVHFGLIEQGCPATKVVENMAVEVDLLGTEALNCATYTPGLYDTLPALGNLQG